MENLYFHSQIIFCCSIKHEQVSSYGRHTASQLHADQVIGFQRRDHCRIFEIKELHTKQSISYALSLVLVGVQGNSKNLSDFDLLTLVSCRLH
jgi:hypothetical protein